MNPQARLFDARQNACDFVGRHRAALFLMLFLLGKRKKYILAKAEGETYEKI